MIRHIDMEKGKNGHKSQLVTVNVKNFLIMVH